MLNTKQCFCHINMDIPYISPNQSDIRFQEWIVKAPVYDDKNEYWLILFQWPAEVKYIIMYVFN